MLRCSFWTKQVHSAALAACFGLVLPLAASGCDVLSASLDVVIYRDRDAATSWAGRPPGISSPSEMQDASLPPVDYSYAVAGERPGQLQIPDDAWLEITARTVQRLLAIDLSIKPWMLARRRQTAVGTARAKPASEASAT